MTKQETERPTSRKRGNLVSQLDRPAIERLDDLVCEAADLNVALGRLFETDNLDDCPAAFKELHDAMDRRLARAIDLLATGDVEG